MRMLNRIAFLQIRKVRIDIFIPISIHLIYGNWMPENPDKNPKECFGIIDMSIFVICIIGYGCIFISYAYKTKFMQNSSMICCIYKMLERISIGIKNHWLEMKVSSK